MTPLGPFRFVAVDGYVLDLMPSVDRVDGGYEAYFLGRGGPPGRTMGRFFIERGPTPETALGATLVNLGESLRVGAATARPVRAAA